MEVGSFLELQFPQGREYYTAETCNGLAIARLNSGKAALWHAFRVTGCRTVWLPYYQCDSVRDFFYRKNVEVKFYHIDSSFTPIDCNPADDEAVLIPNYYGIMSYSRLQKLVSKFAHVILDNCQAFFMQPVANAVNVYSCRKFIGVPDGAYVIGGNADQYVDDYEQCHSSDTAAFLLQRIEYGCEGKAYKSRSENEHRIETEDAMKMSKLTRTILDGTDYGFIKARRRENFAYAAKIFGNINKLDPFMYYDDSCVPMVYPLVVEDDSLLKRLQDAKHFQGHWWSYICDELPSDTFEYYLSRYIIPVTIDQRYGKEELDFIRGVVCQ